MTKKISYHAQYERVSRIEYIIDWCGGEFGETIAEIRDTAENARIVLTEKGIVIIFNLENNTLVTMWIASPAQAIATYKNGHNGREVPRHYMKTFYKNRKASENQPQN